MESNQLLSNTVDESYIGDEEMVATLSNRFPSAARMEIGAVLRRTKGHAGQAGSILRKMFNEQILSPSTAKAPGSTPKEEQNAAEPIPVFIEQELKHVGEYTDRPLPDAGAEETSRLEFPPGIRSVILDIGPNVHPILPPEEDVSVFVIAIEPLPSAVAKMRSRELGPRHSIIPCAIAGQRGLATFKMYNILGVSSSLATPAHPEEYWSTEKGRYGVPVLALQDVLDSIPDSIAISFLKMDLQGYDFEAIQSAGGSLQRVERIACEVWLGGYCSYQGVRNDLARDWYPFMKDQGFEYVKGKENYMTHCCQEADALWRRGDVDEETVDWLKE